MHGGASACCYNVEPSQERHKNVALETKALSRRHLCMGCFLDTPHMKTHGCRLASVLGVEMQEGHSSESSLEHWLNPLPGVALCPLVYYMVDLSERAQVVILLVLLGVITSD